MNYSFIIPALNEEKLLPGLLKILNNPESKKKYGYEIIVSDGGSTDRTVEIARMGSDIVVVHSELWRQNIPQGRNAGAKPASGSILIFINADILIRDINVFLDYIEKNFRYSDYKAMTCMVKIFPAEEILKDKIFHWLYNRYFRLMNLVGVGMGRGECQVIKREVFDAVKGYNEEMAAGEDFDLFRRIRKLGRILFAGNFYVYESPRRYRKYGYKKITLTWMKNGLSVILKNQSANKEWEQVR